MGKDMKLQKTKKINRHVLAAKVWLAALVVFLLCLAGYHAQAQCYEFGSMGYVQICANQTPNFQVQDNCGTFQNYAQCIQFNVEAIPTHIIIDGEQYYTFLPDNVVCTNFWITDLQGNFITGTSCGDIECSEDYNLELDLPLGSYILYISAVGIPVIQPNIQGCVDVTILAGFLSSVQEYERYLEHQRRYDLLGRLRK